MAASHASDYVAFDAAAAGTFIASPQHTDDKYSRGVLGVITGSTQYPGAAVLGVEAALHTGVGMVRYVGPERPSTLVLQRRPEAVTGMGRVQAWLIGSGMAADGPGESAQQITEAIADGVPVILDGGAFGLVGQATGPTIITPHFRELARVTGASVDDIAADPAAAAATAADTLGVTVLLKGHTTFVAGNGVLLSVTSAPAWTATAGAGDALGGILGALVATHADEISADAGFLAHLGAAAAVIHGRAAERASGGGPFTILELARSVSPVVAELVRG